MTRLKKIPIEGELRQSVDFTPLFRSGSSDEIEAACKYEYMRESRTLVDAVADAESKKGSGLTPSFFRSLTVPQFFRLMIGLGRAGFPKPWCKLDEASHAMLIPLLKELRTDPALEAQVTTSDQVVPALSIEPAEVVFDHYGTTADDWYHFRLEPTEPKLIKECGSEDFVGFIRIAKGCNQTDAVNEFRTWFSDHFPKSKGGGGTKWRNRLEQLAVMRICGSIADQWKRLEEVAKYCSYAGCKEETKQHKKRCPEGGADEPMAKKAQVEITNANKEAREFFQRLFPGEEPLSYRGKRGKK